MLIFDILLGVLSFKYCWLDLFFILYEGNEHCNMSPPAAPEPSIFLSNAVQNKQNIGSYEYAQSSLIFTLLSFITIHFVFIWLELFRFVEVLMFHHNKRELKKQKNKNKKLGCNKKRKQQYVSMELMDMCGINEQKIEEEVSINKSDVEDEFDDTYDLNEWIEEVLVYGDEHKANNYEDDDRVNNIELSSKHNKSL